ncbi:ROK family protein [Candidatus Chloroploca asiatica]|uniref:HTH marR-type domain-containing protein n=1 Tax=Candidatus Chloroploca asiatica TaxID=1506545 RepID=A0A2H3KSY1_9CHLR|nr:ROK family protein [Candidatus Chloroploca asiatica]PDV98383.1 hypothetical protein A9Q02_15610 [Candidatus Chloroploca asiatica]
MDPLLEKATRQHTKEHNSRLLLRTIYEYGAISRADLARLTQLTRATVSDAVGELLERGLLEEVGHGTVGIGRTPILLSVVADARQVAAISVTNERVVGALVNLRGELRASVTLDVPLCDGDAILETIYAVADQLRRAAEYPLLGIGINTPGLIDVERGTVVRAVDFGWVDLPLRTLVQERCQLPVYLANDSHSLALAEYMFGQAQGTPDLIVVKVGNGIGAGIVLGDRLYTGEGNGAGEIGHLVVAEDGPLCKCGNRGCLETVASSAAILRQARELRLTQASALSAEPTLEELAHLAQAGDPLARAVIAEAGRYLGIALASLVSVLNIRRVLITGQVAPLGELLRKAVVTNLARRCLPALARATVVEVVALGPDAPLLGAAAPLLTFELGIERLSRP